MHKILRAITHFNGKKYKIYIINIIIIIYVVFQSDVNCRAVITISVIFMTCKLYLSRRSISPNLSEYKIIIIIFYTKAFNVYFIFLIYLYEI